MLNVKGIILIEYAWIIPFLIKLFKKIKRNTNRINEDVKDLPFPKAACCY
jgi:hypothetical protein